MESGKLTRRALMTSLIFCIFCLFAGNVYAEDEEITYVPRGQQAAVTDQLQEDPEMTSEPSSADDASEMRAEMMEAEPAPRHINKAGRIAAEAIGGIFAAAPVFGTAALISTIAEDGGLIDDKAPKTNAYSMRERAYVIAAVMTPFVESAFIHLVGLLMDSRGQDWTPYAGGALGGAIGAGLGAIGFVDERKTGLFTIWIGAAVGAVIGSVTWYELSNNAEIKKNQYISNLHPVIEVSDEYTSLGLGFDF